MADQRALFSRAGCSTGVADGDCSRTAARSAYSDHRLGTSLYTVASLAVIEHVTHPMAFQRDLNQCVPYGAEARIVCRTPHPSAAWVHAAGMRLGLFSWSANDELHSLLDERTPRLTGGNGKLDFAMYRRWLFGANQIAAFRHAPE